MRVQQMCLKSPLLCLALSSRGHSAIVQESATLRPAAAEVLKEVRRTANVYIIAHVVDDLGEATVRGALEAGEPGRLGAARHLSVCSLILRIVC